MFGLISWGGFAGGEGMERWVEWCRYHTNPPGHYNSTPFMVYQQTQGHRDKGNLVLSFHPLSFNWEPLSFKRGTGSSLQVGGGHSTVSVNVLLAEQPGTF